MCKSLSKFGVYRSLLNERKALNLIIIWHLLQIMFSHDIGQAAGIAAVAGIALVAGTASAAAAAS